MGYLESMSQPKNMNRLFVHNKPFHCISVSGEMTTIDFQGGVYTVIDIEEHPLTKAIEQQWGDFLVIYNNTLFYALTDDINGSTVVRMYNVTDDDGDMKSSPDDSTPGWIVMNLKDINVNVEDSTFIRWRYKNSGNERTMDFRVNQVDILPDIVRSNVGQIFWSMTDSVNVVITASGDVHDYDAGVYMCEDARYVRLDFDENQPAFLKHQVKHMEIIGTAPNRELALFAYGYYDDNHNWVANASGNDSNAIITKINAEDWYSHIDVPILDPILEDMTSDYIPSDLSGQDILSSVVRDEYGHVIRYNLMSNVNLRYKWEEI